MKVLRIAIDILGSDSSPHTLFEGVLKASLNLDSSLIFLVLSNSSVIKQLSASYPSLPSNIQFHEVQEEILMSDEPLSVVRHKKNSSLVKGIRLLKRKEVDAFISTGNTGAMIVSATLSLPRLKGIKRPALLASLPTQKGSVVVVDVGGNVSCKAQQLVQFAHLGAAYQRYLGGIKTPRVGLLNIGIESKKGTSEVRQAYQMLSLQKSDKSLNFVGNLEARDIFKGDIDVLITDGFTGNVMLKTIEGFSFLILDALKDWMNKETHENLKKFKKTFNYNNYQGAILCGIEGIVVKCHGNSSAEGFYNGICGVVDLYKKDFIKKIKKELSLANFCDELN